MLGLGSGVANTNHNINFYFVLARRLVAHNGPLQYIVFLIIVIITVTWKIYPAVAQALHQLTQESSEKTPRRRQEVPEGVRDGAPRAVVHTMQVEEGLHQVRGGSIELGPREICNLGLQIKT